MSRKEDQVSVPANGTRAPLDPADEPLDIAPPDAEAPELRSASSIPVLPDLRIAVSPAQAAVGFGVIASLILFVLGRRRRRRR